MTRFATFLALLSTAAPAAAKDPYVSNKIIKETYTVTSSTLTGLIDEMRQKGPNGYWGYAKTNWRWSSSCQMRFWATITMPKHKNLNRLSAQDRKIWQDMLDALWEHEMGHVEIGRAWAAEIKRANCKNVDAINAKHRGNDAAFDRRTKHGKLQGVTLKP